MEIDKTAGVCLLDDGEQTLSGLQREWSLDRPLELVDAWQRQIDWLYNEEPWKHPAGSTKDKIIERHARAVELHRLLRYEILDQLGPYLSQDVPDTAEDFIERGDDSGSNPDE